MHRRVYMLLENGKRSLIRQVKLQKCLKTAIILICGLFLMTGMILIIYGIDFRGPLHVYADSSEYEDQVGLKAVVNSVENMEHYSELTRLISVADSDDEVLAGVSGVDRRVIHRSEIRQAYSKAGQVGYFAEQLVVNNQMISATDYNTLLRIVEAEATSGDIMSKMLVAGVVLNRMNDSRFPDTVYDVVWQNSQFQPVTDGRYYSCSVTDETVEAVNRVLEGEDYSQGALFFVARSFADKSKLRWFDSDLVWLFEYGGHDFYTYKD